MLNGLALGDAFGETSFRISAREAERRHDPGMIGYALAEIRRLLAKISPQQPPGPEHAWSWSRRRRKRQYQASICHYQRRGCALA